MPTRNSAPIGAPCWIDLATSDPDRAKDFYARLFGWTYEVGAEEYGGYINSFLNGSQVAGMMQNTPESGYPDGWTIYLSSMDAQATADLADDSGGQAAMAPMEVPRMGTMAVLVDPGGATIGVWQAAEHTGFEIIDEPGAPVWHELHTRHYRASVLFYETVFGWTTNVEGDSDEFRYSMAEFDGVALAGVMDATNFLSEDTPASWQIYFGVADVDATLALAQEMGGTVLEPAEDSPYGRLAKIADPTGATFKVMTPNQ